MYLRAQGARLVTFAAQLMVVVAIMWTPYDVLQHARGKYTATPPAPCFEDEVFVVATSMCVNLDEIGAYVEDRWPRAFPHAR